MDLLEQFLAVALGQVQKASSAQPLDHLHPQPAPEQCVAQRTRFVHGDGSRLAWDGFDAFYFYNPFHTVMLAPHASPFVRYAAIQGTLRRIEQRLAATPAGTRVVTFHGFGGALPASFTRISREPAGDGALELWVQGAPPRA